MSNTAYSGLFLPLQERWLCRLPVALLHTFVALLPATLAAQELVAKVKTDKGVALADAVVIAMPDGVAPKLPAVPAEEVVDQIDKEFEPYVKAILVGSRVHFPNRDNVRHQVYSFSPAKRFNLPLYAGTPSQPIVFDKPGVVTIGCNIHDWMVGYVYVSASPYFAKTDKAGGATLSDLPTGSYTLQVWHPLQRGTESGTARLIVLGRAETAEIAWTVAVKPDFRARRTGTIDGVVY